MKYRKKKPNGPTVYHVGAHRDIASDQRRRRAHSIQRILCLVAVALFVLPLFVLGVTSLVDQDKTVSAKILRSIMRTRSRCGIFFSLSTKSSTAFLRRLRARAIWC